MKKLTPLKVIYILAIVILTYSIIYTIVNNHSSHFHFSIFFEGLGAIIFFPLLITTFSILARYFLWNKDVTKYEWLYTYFVFAILFAFLSLVSVLNIFPNFFK
jgi:hypothetical protein